MKNIDLETADNTKIRIGKNIVERIGVGLVGIPHMGLRLRASSIFSMLDLKGNILDVGCGPGIYCATFAKEGMDVYGIDVDKRKIKTVKKIFNVLELKGTFRVASVLKLPFPDKKFDNVLCSDVLEHIKDDKKAIYAVARVLKKNGILILTIPEREHCIETNKEMFGHVRAGYTIGEIKKLLQKENLEVIDYKYYVQLFGAIAWKINRALFLNKLLTALTFYPLYLFSKLDKILPLSFKGGGLTIKAKRR